jgi:hypothetical protein
MLQRAAEEALVGPNRLVEVRDGDADVVDTSCLHAAMLSAGPPGAAV